MSFVDLARGLHRAHRELARKAVRIAALEELLEKNEIAIPEETAQEDEKFLPKTHAERKLSDAISKIRELEKRLITEESKTPEVPETPEKKIAKGEEKAGPKKKSRGKKQQKAVAEAPAEKPSSELLKEKAPEVKPAGAMILIHYLADSAVNLEGRERALEFVMGVLERSPDAVFRVEGGADDSEYETSDKVIAENRARFLVEYLKYRKIPAEVFREIEGVSSKEKEGPGKYVRLSVISG